ncbi:UDP-N-acetylglucosamine 1-carboxyvinyltransferase [Patescibacteria group bacterium]
MAKFVIKGGKPLKGAVRLGGAKNASFKLMIASLLAKGESRLLNFSHIADVEITRKIIEALGAKVKRSGERTLFVQSFNLNSYIVPEKLGLASRASTMFIGPLLFRKKKAIVPLPGGDKIGKRPLDRHFNGLKALGAKISFESGVFKVIAENLKGAYYKFPKNTHTGTETLLMAAAGAKGKSILDNAAKEPEVDELIDYLNKMGAKIKRISGRKIEVIGVDKFNPVIHRIMPDRNEAVSYAVAAIASKGDVIVENAKVGDLKAFLEKIDESGGGYEVGNYGIRFFYKGKLKAVDIITKPHPGFMTDWQPLWSILATQSLGTSTITEAVHISRFQYVSFLQNMGAKISYFHPQVADLNTFYNFNSKDDIKKSYHAIKIQGPTSFKAVKAKVPDLRAGATLVLAGIIAKGKTVLENIEHIDRGYEDLDGRLVELGAEIERQK